MHAAIVALGCAPGLGFIHTGHVLSFVFDIADLYKTDIAIPIAFDIASEPVADIGAATRRAVRDRMKGGAFLEKCVHDIKSLLLDDQEAGDDELAADVVMLWDNNGRQVRAGTAYGDSEDFDTSYAEISGWLEEDW